MTTFMSPQSKSLFQLSVRCWKKFLTFTQISEEDLFFIYPYFETSLLNHLWITWGGVQWVNRMCSHQTNIKRNGKITDFDETWVGWPTHG